MASHQFNCIVQRWTLNKVHFGCQPSKISTSHLQPHTNSTYRKRVQCATYHIFGGNKLKIKSQASFSRDQNQLGSDQPFKSTFNIVTSRLDNPLFLPTNPILHHIRAYHGTSKYCYHLDNSTYGNTAPSSQQSQQAQKYNQILETKMNNKHFTAFDKTISAMKNAHIPLDVDTYRLLIRSFDIRRSPTTCLMLLKEEEESNIVPDLETYHHVINSLSWTRNTGHALNIYNKLLNAGHAPTIETYHALLDVCLSSKNGEILDFIESEMTSHQISHNLETYTRWIKVYHRNNNVEKLCHLWDVLHPNSELVDSNEQVGELSITGSSENQAHESLLFQLDPSMIDLMLQIFIHHNSITGLKKYFGTFSKHNLLIPEATYLRSLEAIARARPPSPELADWIWMQLEQQGLISQTCISAMLLICAFSKQYKRIFDLLNKWMPTFSLHPIVFEQTCQSLEGNQELLNWMRNSLEEMPNPVIECYNILIGASIPLRSSKQLIEYYNNLKSRGLVPTSETWETLLRGLATLGDMERIQFICTEMEGCNILDLRCKEHLIRCKANAGLWDQVWEDLKDLTKTERPSFGLFYALTKRAKRSHQIDVAQDIVALAVRMNHASNALNTIINPHNQAEWTNAFKTKDSYTTSSPSFQDSLQD